MTRLEHLLTILGEECNEVGQRTSKALRFGLDEVEPGQELTNRQRIAEEISDLIAIIGLLRVEAKLEIDQSPPRLQAKLDKIETFLEYSRTCGTLTYAHSES